MSPDNNPVLNNFREGYHETFFLHRHHDCGAVDALISCLPQAPDDMESLRLPPTVGLRVVVAYEEKEGKRARDETASKLHMLNWDSE